MLKKLKSRKNVVFQNLEQLKKAGITVYALVYCRVSSDRQARDGHGLETQEQRCKDFALRSGYIVEKVFKDTASGGGAYTKRQGQVDLLEYIDKYPHKNFVVIVDDISRVARDVQAHFQLRLLLKERGVEVASPNFNFEDSPEGEMIEGVMAMVSQYQRKGNARQVVQKQKARMMLGYWPFPSVKPFKMTRDPNHGTLLVAQYPEAEYVKEALEKFTYGTFVRKVDACQFLLDKGYWKGKRAGRYIDKFTELAQNILMAGYIEYPEWEVPRIEARHEGIITLDIYNLLQKRLRKENLSGRVRVDISPEFPLRGLVLCDCCHKPLRGGISKGNTKKYSYYVCQTIGCKYYGKSIRKVDIEDRFDEVLLKHSLKSEVDKLLDKVFDGVWKEEVINLKTKEAIQTSQKSSLEKKAEQLTEKILTAKSSTLRNMFEVQLENVGKEIENLAVETDSEIDFSVPYRTVLDKTRVLLKSPYVIWKKLDVHEQHRLFYFIFDEKLPYDIKEGYRTDKIPQAIRLFEEFVVQNPFDVGKGRLELPILAEPVPKTGAATNYATCPMDYRLA